MDKRVLLLVKLSFLCSKTAGAAHKALLVMIGTFDVDSVSNFESPQERHVRSCLTQV